MADLQENQMVEIAAAFVRCLDSARNSGVISLNNLFARVLKFDGWLDNTNNCDDIKTTGFYALSGLTNAKYAWGMLIVLAAEDKYLVQINIASDLTHIGFRNIWGSNWSAWKSIDLK